MKRQHGLSMPLLRAVIAFLCVAVGVIRAGITTPLPPDIEWPEENLSWTKLEIDRMARVSLTGDLTLRDLYLLHEDARLHLNGYTLRLRAAYHDDWGSEANVVYDGGEIIWSLTGTLFMVR